MHCTHVWPITPDEFGQYYIVAITTITIAIAAPGNLLTAIVVIQNISLRNEPAYILICSVCFADAIVAIVTQPLFMTTVLLGSRCSCLLDNVFFTFAWLSSVSSTLGIVAITFDRYAYIVHPMRYQTMMTKARAKCMICVVWIVAILFSILPLFYHNKMILHTSVLGIMLLISFFMAGTYSKVYRQVINTAKHPKLAVTGSCARQRKNLSKLKTQNQATKTVLFVVLAFVGCWFPWVIVSFLMALGDFIPYLKQLNLFAIHWIFLGLGYTNSALNIFIYSRKNTVLQKAVSRYLLKRKFPLLSCILAGKQIEQRSPPHVAYVEEARLRAATVISQSNKTPMMDVPVTKSRSHTFISGLSF